MANLNEVRILKASPEPVHRRFIVLYVVKAGRAIPLKWRLTDATGAPVTTLPSVQISVVGISCSLDTTRVKVESGESLFGLYAEEKPDYSRAMV